MACSFLTGIAATAHASPVHAGATAPPVHAATTASPSGSDGYWMAASDGGVYEYGAPDLGELRGTPLNQPIVAMAATPDGKGYWLVASDGGVFAFGDAGFYGSTGNIRLNKPIVGMAPTPDGKGYWLVASDGGVFAFGDAGFYGSTGNIRLNKPVVGMAPTSDGKGYWLVASDGGIFNFGDAKFFGSTGNVRLNKPIVGMSSTADGGGYWLVASDGGIFNFGDAPFLGSAGAAPGPAPMVSMASTAHGFLFAQNATGYDVSWPQCGGAYPPPGSPVDVVGVTNGYIGVSGPGGYYGPNPCFPTESSWAGPGMQAYQVATPINGAWGDVSDATAGPQACPTVANTNPCGYNWGFNNTIQAIDYAHSQGHYPGVWWLDVELDEGWNFATPSFNASIIQGMIDAARSQGLTAGVYGTNYQWGKITGGYQLTGVPTWIAGAGNLNTGTYSAAAFCADSWYDFGSGKATLVQYGYTGSGYTGTKTPFDLDYSCP